MRTTIDKAGRVVVPAAVRAAAGLAPGIELEVVLEEDLSVRLVRTAPGPKLVKLKNRLVARPTVAREALPAVDLAGRVEEERDRWPW